MTDRGAQIPVLPSGARNPAGGAPESLPAFASVRYGASWRGSPETILPLEG
jgi:hypothetical protein